LEINKYGFLPATLAAPELWMSQARFSTALIA
jgi:hypothetical protein